MSGLPDSEIAENVNSAALYDRLVAKGHSHAEASFMVRDLMNFSMSGNHAVVRFLTQLVSSVNARLLGQYKLGRTRTTTRATSPWWPRIRVARQSGPAGLRR